MRLSWMVLLAAGALIGAVPAASAQSLAVQAGKAAAGGDPAHMVSPPTCTTAACQQVKPTHKVIHPNIASFHKPMAMH